MQIQNTSFKNNLLSQANQGVSQSKVAISTQKPVNSPEKSSKQKAREIFDIVCAGITVALGGFLAISSIVGHHKLSKNIKVILGQGGEMKKQALKELLHKFSLDKKVALTKIMADNIGLLKDEPDKFLRILEEKSKGIFKTNHDIPRSNSGMTDSLTDAFSTVLDF